MTARATKHEAPANRKGGASLTKKEERRERGALAELIRKHRKDKGWSLDDLSRKTRLSRGYLGDLEAGRKGSNLSEHTLDVLAKALGFTRNTQNEVVNSQTENVSTNGKSIASRKYGEHYRILRSNVRAHKVAKQLARIRTAVEAARSALLQGDDASKMLQDIVTAAESIDDTLAYRKKPPVCVRPIEDSGDDEKYFEFGRSG